MRTRNLTKKNWKSGYWHFPQKSGLALSMEMHSSVWDPFPSPPATPTGYLNWPKKSLFRAILQLCKSNYPALHLIPDGSSRWELFPTSLSLNTLIQVDRVVRTHPFRVHIWLWRHRRKKKPKNYVLHVVVMVSTVITALLWRRQDDCSEAEVDSGCAMRHHLKTDK